MGRYPFYWIVHEHLSSLYAVLNRDDGSDLADR